MDADYRIFKRKLYERMLNWKHSKDGKTALLIKGARRVGKLQARLAKFTISADGEFVQVPLAQITWYHNISKLPKGKDGWHGDRRMTLIWMMEEG